MRNLKRVLSLALALVMVLGMMVITTSAADFTDAEEITYTEAVDVMSALGILKGYEAADGTYSFNPAGTLNRQEAAKILAFVCLGDGADDYLTGSAVSFEDVDAAHWAAKYITFCKNAKIVDGVNDAKTLFNPTGTLTTVQFAKMLLGAIGIEGEFTGAGWEDAVKKAVASVGTLDATGIEIDNSDITREEACELALAAMKYDPTASGYVVVNAQGDVVKTFDDLLEASIYATTLSSATQDTYTAGPATGTDNLLAKMYDVETVPGEDAFKRPGTMYQGITAGNDFELLVVDEPLATFEGVVTQKEIFAAAKVTSKTQPSITYTLYEEGIENGTAWPANKDNAKSTDDDDRAAGTGNGIKSELYKVGTDYILVSVREFMGTVDTVTPATEGDATSKRTITVKLDVEDHGYIVCDAYVTEDFKEKDRVLVTVAENEDGDGLEIQTIKVPTTVTGTVSKLNEGTIANNKADDVVTINGAEYAYSQNTTATVKIDGKEASWYVDSMGNLIADVTPADPAKATVYYAYLVDYARAEYAEGADTLLEAGKVTEASEKFQIVTAEGEKLVLDGAVKVEERDDGSFKTTFAAPKFTYEKNGVSNTKGVLISYELNDKGQITKANESTSYYVNEVTVAKGVAKVGNKYVTSETVFFYVEKTTNKVTAYVGYNNVPKSATGTADRILNATDNDVLEAILVTDATIDTGYVAATNHVYFADTNYTTLWDPAANDGEGGTYVLYENVYVNGVKAAEGLKFAKAQDVAAGTIYTFTVSNTTGLATKTGTLVDATGEGTKVTLLEETYFKAGSVEYTDEDTVFWQVDKTAKTITVVDAVAAPTQTQNTYVLKVVENADQTAAALVIFYTGK